MAIIHIGFDADRQECPLCGQELPVSLYLRTETDCKSYEFYCDDCDYSEGNTYD